MSKRHVASIIWSDEIKPTEDGLYLFSDLNKKVVMITIQNGLPLNNLDSYEQLKWWAKIC